MKFTCLQENLAKGLNTVYKAVPTKSALPILSNILLSAEEGRLKLSATNLETSITTYVGASVQEEGAASVPAKLLREFITTLPPSTVSAELKNDILHISSEKTKSKFNCAEASEYPELPTMPKDAKYIEIDPKVFAHDVSIVGFAAATDDSRPLFTGIYVTYSEGKLILAATDGFRLSEKTLQVKGGANEFSAIIPAKTLVEVAKLFAAYTEPIKIVLNEAENLVLFEGEDTLIATRIIDGQYPDYKRIIPTVSKMTAEFLASELLEAVRLTSIFSKEDSGAIKIKFDQDGTVYILTTIKQVGEHESKFAAQIEGEVAEIAFNSKYLLDLLNNVKAERMVFIANTNLTPCIIKPIDTEDFMHIIMPMQIQD